MGDSFDDELHALRSRAYGPDADISGDPVALARLRHLESQTRTGALIEVPPRPPAPSLPAVPSVSFSEPSDVRPATPAAGSVAAAAPDVSTEPTEATVLVRRRRLPVIAAAAISAVAAAAITVPVTLWSAAQSDRPDAVLKPLDAPVDDVFFSPESEAQRFEDFFGIRVTTGIGAEGVSCLLVELDPQDDPSFTGGATRGGCSAPGFEAVVDVSLTEQDVPETVRDALGDVSGIRFSVEGDEVFVYLSDVPDPARPS